MRGGETQNRSSLQYKIQRLTNVLAKYRQSCRAELDGICLAWMRTPYLAQPPAAGLRALGRGPVPPEATGRAELWVLVQFEILCYRFGIRLVQSFRYGKQERTET